MKWYPAITEFGTPDFVTERVFRCVQKMKRDEPARDDFRTAGQCPVCRAEGLISYIWHGLNDIKIEDCVEMQSCGNWCAYCGFSGSTRRMVVDE